MKFDLQNFQPKIIKELYLDKASIFGDYQAFENNFGYLKIKITENYYSSFKKKRAIYECSISDYIKECEVNPDFNFQCTEISLFNEINEYFLINNEKFNLPDPESQYFFIAFKGAIAPVHFDWDFCNVFLTQIFGRKRIVLFEPKIGKRLFPISNTSTISFHSLSLNEQKKIIKFNKGYEFIINPGETLAIPKLWWHYVEYLDIGASINYRFGNQAYERSLVNLPRHHYLQTIGYYLSISKNKKQKKNIIKQILSMYYTYYDDSEERYLSMRSLYKKIYSDVCKEGIIGDYTGDNFDFELTINKNNTLRNYNLPFEISELTNKINALLDKQNLLMISKYLGFEPKKIEAMAEWEQCSILHTILKSQ